MSNGTYGGITRSSNPIPDLSYKATGDGCLTPEILKKVWEAIMRQDEAAKEREREFYRFMRPFNRLLNEKDFVGYIAAYRLMQSVSYPGCALHPKNYAECVEILAERNLWPIPVDSTSR
jgi:hypothetical protein